MSELVKKARQFATQAHRRIDQRRRYTGQPYEVHLKSVAQLVVTVTDDQEMIAAAWLHDTVEDTEATIEDIEREFGRGVAGLVADLTDVSKPGDGNRAARKAVDREHTAKASARAKTVKLADIVDNCKDICKHDVRFARVYLREAKCLLEVLREGDSQLYRRADRAIEKCVASLGLSTGQETAVAAPQALPVNLATSTQDRRTLRLFTEAFTAQDIAEPLRSFDDDRPAEEVGAVLSTAGLQVATVRRDGLIYGYLERSELGNGPCSACARRFAPGQVVEANASLAHPDPHATLLVLRFDARRRLGGRGEGRYPEARGEDVAIRHRDAHRDAPDGTHPLAMARRRVGKVAFSGTAGEGAATAGTAPQAEPGVRPVGLPPTLGQSPGRDAGPETSRRIRVQEHRRRPAGDQGTRIAPQQPRARPRHCYERLAADRANGAKPGGSS